MYTRKQYLDGNCTHSAYYGQFVTPQHINTVVRRIGASKLKSSTDEDLNDIPLRIWDTILSPVGTNEKMKLCGDYNTLSSQICIAKEAARQWLETQK